MRRTARLLAASAALVLSACVTLGPGPGHVVPWSKLPGWPDAALAEAWPALLHSCSKLAARDPAWRELCAQAQQLQSPDDATVRAFIERHFEARLQRAGLFRSTGLITGYYEPLLFGSRSRTERYRYPLYRVPDDLLTVELGDLYPELRGKRVRGRLEGRRVVPYYSRAQIERDPMLLAGNELFWVDDPIALFVLQIQGSGRVQLPDGQIVAVGYADQNGHPYTAIGRTLVQHAGLSLEEIDLPTIRRWLAEHPREAQAIMHTNASYVFFQERDAAAPGPIGSLGVPLLPERAIAVDPAYIPLGVPVWLDTTLPGSDAPYRRLVFAQDTGGAIRGPVRADVFFGRGPAAEDYAGRMKQPGRLYVLFPVRSP